MRSFINRLPVLPVILSIFIFACLACAGEDEFVTALTGKFPPFSYYDQTGSLTGFDVDVAREISSRLGLESRIITTEWDGILAGLLTGKYDAIVGSMAITAERQRQVSFSQPYYESGAQLFVHRENPHKIYSIDDCDQLQIAVVLGETYQNHLENNHPKVRVLTFKSTVEIFEMLDQGRIAGFVTDRLVGAWQIRQAGRMFVPVGEMLYEEKIGIPVQKSEPELLQKINDSLEEMEADGTMKALFAKYFGLRQGGAGTATKMPKSVVAGKLLKGFSVTLSIAFVSVITGFLLAIPIGVLLSFQQGVWKLPAIIARIFVDFIRGTPVLIQLLFVWMGLGLAPVPAAILTLAVCTMAYMAEAVRSGLIAVNPGQNLAAKALGLKPLDRFRHVIWPQAFRIALPSLMNNVVALIKDTALISIISIAELIREAQSIISVTFEPRKYYFIAAMMFFAVTFPLMKISANIERRISARGFSND